MGILCIFKWRIYEFYYAIALKLLRILWISVGIWHVITFSDSNLKKKNLNKQTNKKTKRPKKQKKTTITNYLAEPPADRDGKPKDT